MNINEIIYHLITGTASDKERMHFDAWLKESPDHQEKYEKLMENSDFWKDYQNYSQIDVDKAPSSSYASADSGIGMVFALP